MSVISLERSDIEMVLPHRDNWLLLDRAEIDLETGTATGYLTVREELCAGHFPGNLILPGVSRLEFISQALGLVAMYGMPEGTGVLLLGGGKYSFRNPAVPGDLVIARSQIVEKRGSRGITGEGIAYVGDKVVAESYGITGIIGKR